MMHDHLRRGHVRAFERSNASHHPGENGRAETVVSTLTLTTLQFFLVFFLTCPDARSPMFVAVAAPVSAHAEERESRRDATAGDDAVCWYREAGSQRGRERTEPEQTVRGIDYFFLPPV